MLDTLPPAIVLAAYPVPVADAKWTALGAAGGFSGSRLWRGRAADGREFAMKAYPTDADPGRLEQVHRWMAVARAAGLDFVPTVERTRHGGTFVVRDGRAWDVVAWMPGRADFHADPTDVKLIGAVRAVAGIHDAWSKSEGTREGPCPAVERRWRALTDWEGLLHTGWRPRFEPDDPVRPHAEAAWNVLPLILPRVRVPLRYWLTRPVRLQPCLGDVWLDHILYEGDRVAGVIDYAAAKVDHPTADLARLLGSLVPGDGQRAETALAAYIAVRPLPDVELVGLLDLTGTAAAVANWLRRLFHDREAVADRQAVAARLAGLVRRLAADGV